MERGTRQALEGRHREGRDRVDGQSPHLATARNYGDFELYVDWLMVNHNGDSGIYLRGKPQVQVWDPDNPREVRNGAPKGSGALWNNSNDNPGKWPLVKADKPVGEWNTFHVKMVGPKVWVIGRSRSSAKVRSNCRPTAPKSAFATFLFAS